MYKSVNKLHRNCQLTLRLQQQKFYHSEKGVFGFKPRAKSEYRGNAKSLTRFVYIVVHSLYFVEWKIVNCMCSFWRHQNQMVKSAKFMNELSSKIVNSKLMLNWNAKPKFCVYVSISIERNEHFQNVCKWDLMFDTNYEFKIISTM
jgi:hypothetical protein